jgi:putative sterol carrier protein
MGVRAFSDEFAKAYQAELNKSEKYRQASKGWKWKVGLVVEAEPDRNFEESKGVLLDLFEGEARDVQMVSADQAKAADFVITGAYSRWKDVMQKKLDPTRAMLTGKLKVKGDLATLMRYTRAANEMTEATTRIDVDFPDE